MREGGVVNEKEGDESERQQQQSNSCYRLNEAVCFVVVVFVQDSRLRPSKEQTHLSSINMLCEENGISRTAGTMVLHFSTQPIRYTRNKKGRRGGTK